MRVVRLSELRLRGLALTAHESVAVVHEVCRLMQEAAQHDRPISAPSLGELFVDETGELIIEPIHPARPGHSDSLSCLIDELLPAHIDDLPPGRPGDAWSLAGDASGQRERSVLRALFQRASVVSAPVFEPEPTSAGDPLRANPLPVDESVEWLDTQPEGSAALLSPVPEWVDPAPEPTETELTPVPAMAEAADDDTFEPIVEPIAAPEPVVARRPRRRWQRRAVVWGLALDAALGVIIGVKLGLIPIDKLPTWNELVDLASLPARAGDSTALPAPLPTADRPHDHPPNDSLAVQQLPNASSLTTPEVVEAEPDAGSPARRGTLISARAPSGAFVPNLVEGADHTSPSPDGRHMAFDLDRDGVRGVFIADRHGANVVLASGEGRAASPSWSPDARYLAFVRAEPDRPRVWNLWMREIRSGALMQLTKYPIGIVRGGSWFPDGRRICYAHQQTLVIQDVQSGRMRVFSSPVPSGLIRAPSVSPDGSHVAFEIEGSGIWMMDVEQRAMEQIIDDPTPSSLAWRPDDGLTYFSVAAREWRTWRPAPSS